MSNMLTKYPIPDAALDDRLGFVGMTGSGKTFGAGTCVERILAKRGRVIIPDPLGVWWGLRQNSDGKTPSPYEIVIFGGPHADLPVTPHAGAIIGETAAGMRESAIIDLSQFETAASERRFMLAFLDALYRRSTGEPVHLIFDEADLWAPERIVDKEGEATKLHGMMQSVVRRGRIKGLTSWLISQRPAALSKNVLSQVDGLVAFRLTASQDRKALGAWIEGQAGRDAGKAILGRLPEKKQGEAVVWLPQRGILTDLTFPMKETYDSSRAPKRGETCRRIDLCPLDLGALKDRLSTIEAEVKANDPKVLRAEIAGLRKQLQAASGAAARLGTSQDRINNQATIEMAADKAGYERGYKEGAQAAKEVIASKAEAVAEAVNALRMTILPTPSYRAPQARPAPRPAPISKPKQAANNGHAIDGDRPLGAERRPLAVLAGIHPAGMTEAQWAVAASLKRRGGTWTAYVSRLRAAGRAERRGDLWFATDDGLNDLGSYSIDLPAPGPRLVEFWAAKISGVAPMLRRLSEVYPLWISREQLAQDLSLMASGGTFTAYLSRLRSPGLIEEDGDRNVRAATALMEG